MIADSADKTSIRNCSIKHHHSCVLEISDHVACYKSIDEAHNRTIVANSMSTR